MATFFECPYHDPMAIPAPTDTTPYSTKIHRMVSGRQVRGVSHSWASAVEIALEEVLAGSPDLRHVAIQVTFMIKFMKAQFKIAEIIFAVENPRVFKLTWINVCLS